MKFLFLIAAMTITSLALAAPRGDRKDWKLVFGDEVNGRDLDTGKWSHNYPWGAQHNHLAYMDPSHVSVANGKLVLRASEEMGWVRLDFTRLSVSVHARSRDVALARCRLTETAYRRCA